MSAASEIQPMFFDEEGGSELEIQFDPRQFRAVTPYSDDLDLEDEYEAAQDELRILKQKEEQLRRQTEELKELTRQEESFRSGRAEVTEALNRHLETLESEVAEAQRRSDECAAAHERLEAHLSGIASLRPETWSRADRKAELARALGHIEAAEEEIESVRPLLEGQPKKGGRLSGLFGSKGSQASATHGGDFRYWLKSGFAFSLPFAGFGLVAILVVLFL